MASRLDDKSSSSNGSWSNAVCVVLLCVSNCVTFWINRSPARQVPAGVSATYPSAPSSNALAVADTRECCNLAYQHSFGLFDDIPDAAWLDFYQKPSLNPPRYHNPNSPNDKAAKEPTLWVFENFDPWFNCPRKHRLGGLGDGPKYTCDPDRLQRLFEHRQKAAQEVTAKPCLAYSFVDGNRDSYRWEESLAKLVPSKCEIHIFDYKKGRGKPLWAQNETYNFIQFHPWALKSTLPRSNPMTSVATETVLSFAEIRKRLNHEGRTIDFLKMDCGGCEWDTWSEWIDSDVRQLLLKTQGLPDNPSEFFEAVRARGLELFSKETDCTNGGRGDSTDWSWIKLAPAFRVQRSAASQDSQRH